MLKSKNKSNHDFAGNITQVEAGGHGAAVGACDQHSEDAAA